MSKARRKPLIFAHRGASAGAPENTLAAFRLAFEEGADGIELDAKLTLDGHVVVMHDATVDRTTDGVGRVAERRLADIRALDAGARFSNRFRGEKVPLLAEVLEECTKRGAINIEIANYATPRDGLAEAVCSLLRNWRDHATILLSSFLPGNLAVCARLLPTVPRGLLAMPGWRGAWARSFGFEVARCQALHPHVSDASPQQVRRVHRHGRQVHVWTVNDAAVLRRMQAIGVDGVFTDDPLKASLELGRRD